MPYALRDQSSSPLFYPFTDLTAVSPFRANMDSADSSNGTHSLHGQGRFEPTLTEAQRNARRRMAVDSHPAVDENTDEGDASNSPVSPNKRRRLAIGTSMITPADPFSDQNVRPTYGIRQNFNPYPTQAQPDPTFQTFGSLNRVSNLASNAWSNVPTQGPPRSTFAPTVSLYEQYYSNPQQSHNQPPMPRFVPPPMMPMSYSGPNPMRVGPPGYYPLAPYSDMPPRRGAYVEPLHDTNTIPAKTPRVRTAARPATSPRKGGISMKLFQATITKIEEVQDHLRECPACQLEFDPGNFLVEVSCCKTVMHVVCFSAWLHSSIGPSKTKPRCCMKCRKKIDAKAQLSQYMAPIRSREWDGNQDFAVPANLDLPENGLRIDITAAAGPPVPRSHARARVASQAYDHDSLAPLYFAPNGTPLSMRSRALAISQAYPLVDTSRREAMMDALSARDAVANRLNEAQISLNYYKEFAEVGAATAQEVEGIPEMERQVRAYQEQLHAASRTAERSMRDVQDAGRDAMILRQREADRAGTRWESDSDEIEDYRLDAPVAPTVPGTRPAQLRPSAGPNAGRNAGEQTGEQD